MPITLRAHFEIQKVKLQLHAAVLDMSEHRHMQYCCKATIIVSTICACTSVYHVQAGGAGEGFEVQKYGDGRVALIGFPSVGKSTLLSQLTGTESEAAAYEFTTLTCIPGVIHYKGTKIQLLDLPGIIEGAAAGKGRGRQVRNFHKVGQTSQLP